MCKARRSLQATSLIPNRNNFAQYQNQRILLHLKFRSIPSVHNTPKTMQNKISSDPPNS